MYTKYIQDLCQSRLSTADYALFLVASATTAVSVLFCLFCYIRQSEYLGDTFFMGSVSRFRCNGS
jgi:hypothetical protein